jgi:hypothetical protein
LAGIAFLGSCIVRAPWGRLHLSSSLSLLAAKGKAEKMEIAIYKY